MRGADGRRPSDGRKELTPSTGPHPPAGGCADDDLAARLSTFRHEMFNLLGVVLTYCDLLAGDETNPSKIAWLEQQGSATKQAIELMKGLRSS